MRTARAGRARERMRGIVAGTLLAFLCLPGIRGHAGAQPAVAPTIPQEFAGPLDRIQEDLDGSEYEQVLEKTKELIPALLQVPETSPGVRAALVLAYEYRARALFGLGEDEPALHPDLEALLAL